MAASPILGFTLLVEGQAQGETSANTILLRMETIKDAKVIDDSLATPPGSPADGDLYIVAASPTGAWTGQAAKLAWYHNGWTFITPKGGWQAFIVNKKQLYCYSSVESLWFPVDEYWSTTEHWTGLYRDGAKVYSKVVDMNAGGSSGPNSGTVTKAHGITGQDFTKPVLIKCSAALGGTVVPGPNFVDFSAGLVMGVGVDSTNVVWGANFNMSTATMKVRLEYCK